MNVVFLTVILAATILGAGLVPFAVYLISPSLGPGMRGVLARIIWTIGALTHGPYAIRQEENLSYEVYPADPEETRIYVDGEWQDVNPDSNWSYLGKQDILITWKKSREMLGDLVADLNGVEVQADGGGHEVHPYRLGIRPGGVEAASKYASHAAGFVVEIPRVVRRWRRAAGSDIADEGKKQAMKDHGGDSNMSNKMLVVGTVLCLALGAVTGWLFV